MLIDNTINTREANEIFDELQREQRRDARIEEQREREEERQREFNFERDQGAQE